MPDLEIVGIANGSFVENCYLIADRSTGEVVVIDPGEEADLFLNRIAAEGWTVKAIWLSHAHLDHIAGLKTVRDATGAEVWLHPADRVVFDHFAESCARFGMSFPIPDPPDHEIAAGDEMSAAVRYHRANRDGR